MGIVRRFIGTVLFLPVFIVNGYIWGIIYILTGKTDIELKFVDKLAEWMNKK